ncbi:MAG: ABA4-like family protein [Pseudomonadota bacterium]|nr:ABA4-like family protein [Pseudomonadota bacterium]
MDWGAVFSSANIVALIAWVGLIALPRWPVMLSAILYLVVGGLCALYCVLLFGALSGFIPAGNGGADFTTIEGVRTIFASDIGVVIGWSHYLAFDLFIGIWIARDADAKFFSRYLQAPILLATFLAGPVGLIAWLLIREPRARARGRFT